MVMRWSAVTLAVLVVSAVSVAHAQQAPLVPVTVTLTPQEYQAVLTGLGELPLKSSLDAFAAVTKAERDAQAMAAAAKKPPNPASSEKTETAKPKTE